MLENYPEFTLDDNLNLKFSIGALLWNKREKMRFSFLRMELNYHTKSLMQSEVCN